MVGFKVRHWYKMQNSSCLVGVLLSSKSIPEALKC